MNRIILRHMIVLLIALFCNSEAQEIKYPCWIDGVWHNSAESNTNRFVFFIFSNDSIKIDKGFPDKRTTVLNEKYKDYEITQFSSDSLYSITFSKDTIVVKYEFRLHSVNFSKEKVLTNLIDDNNETEGGHTASCNLVLLKLKSD